MEIKDQYRIKVIRPTPYSGVGDVFTLSEFREICEIPEGISDEWVIKNLMHEINMSTLFGYPIGIKNRFELIKIDTTMNKERLIELAKEEPVRVVTRNGETFIAICGRLCNPSLYFYISDRRENLLSMGRSGIYDIMEVYRAPSRPCLWTDPNQKGELIWKREEEPKEISIKEAEEALKERFGENIKIKDDENTNDDRG